MMICNEKCWTRSKKFRQLKNIWTWIIQDSTNIFGRSNTFICSNISMQFKYFNAAQKFLGAQIFFD